MTIRRFAALTAIFLLGACREVADNPSNSVAMNESATTAAAKPATPVSAEQARKLFHERHEGMEKIGKSTKAIGQQLKSDSPDMAVVRSSAATIADLAPKSAHWFPAGTDRNVLPKTRALPAIWQKPEDFAAKDRDFQEVAQVLNAAATAGDIDAVTARFADLGKACKACHDTYRAEKHPK